MSDRFRVTLNGENRVERPLEEKYDFYRLVENMKPGDRLVIERVGPRFVVEMEGHIHERDGKCWAICARVNPAKLAELLNAADERGELG